MAKSKTVTEASQVSEIELVYKSKVKASQRRKVITSEEAYDVFHQTWDKDKIDFVEQFKVLYLNRASQVLAVYEVSTGGTKASIVDFKLILVPALKLNAVSILLAHNHPSGNLQPSHQDIITTKRLKEAGQLLDIKVVDHLIITSEGYYSFCDEGTI